jgi:hypothetical protein
VLEINETGTGFFEKAIFFVKPEYIGMSEGKLRESASKELEQTGKPPIRSCVVKKSKIKKLLTMLCPFFIGLAIGIAVTSVF